MANIDVNDAAAVGRGITTTDRLLGWTAAGVVKADTLQELIATIKPGRFYTGSHDPITTPPSGAIEGDIYIRNTGVIYQRGVSAFASTGLDISGADGTDGKAGHRWFVGNQAPTPTNVPTAVAGDYFLLNNGQVYSRGATAFTDTHINLRGAMGVQGFQGKYLIRIYRSSASAVASVSGGTYNVGTQVLTPPTDWAVTVPATVAGQKIYEAQAEINPATQSGSITPSWGTPFDLGGTGAAGYTGGWQYTAYQNAATKPAKPNTGTYNKLTGAITLPSGWGANPTTPPSGEEVWATLSFILPHSRSAGLVSLNWSEPAQITASSMTKGDAGVGVPTGGTTGQILGKKSGTDYDTQWIPHTSHGLQSVSSDTTLTGVGTTTDPLKVAVPFTSAEKKAIDAAVARVANSEPQATADQTPAEIKTALETLKGNARLDVSAIQNVPAAGLASVNSDATLSGDGGSTNPLTVANPFTAADETKLDGIESNATTDQSAAEIKAALEGLSGTAKLDASAIKNIPASIDKVLSDSTLNGDGTVGNNLSVANPYSKAEKDKLATIEAAATADQTGADIKAELEKLTTTSRLDASAIQNLPSGGVSKVVSDATLSGDGLTATPLKVANPFSSAEKSKLAAIEANATADQSAAEIKTALETLKTTARLDASAIQNIPAPGISKALSDRTLLGDGTFGNNLSVAHPYSAEEKTKLAGIEAGAKADQTGAEIKAELEKLTGTNRLDGSAIQNISGLSSAEKTKLAGIETAATADQTAAEIKTALETLTANDRLDVTAIKNLKLSSQTATQLKQSLETLTGDNRLAATAINLNTDDSLEGTGSKALPLKLSFEATTPEEAERARDATNYITPFDLSRFVYNKTDHIALKEEHHDISGVTHDGTHITFISDRKDVFDIDLDTAKHPSDYRGIAYLGLLNDDDANYKIERSNSFYFVADADTHSIGITRITLNGNKHDTTGAAALRTAVGLGATGVMQTRALAAEWGLDDTLAVIFSDDNVMKFAVTTYDSTNIRAHGNYTTRWNFPADLTAPLDADWNQYRDTMHVLDGYKIRAFKVADGTEDATRSYNLPQTLPAPTGFTIKAPYIWVSTAQTIYAVDLATLSYVENGSIPVANTIRHGTVTRSQGLGFVNEADAYTPSMERNIHLSMQLNANPPMASHFYGISGSFTTSLQLMNVGALGSSVNDGFGGITDRAYCMTIKEGTLEAYVVCWDGTNKRLYKLDLFTGEAFAFPNILNVGLAEPMAITFHYNKLFGITSDGRLFEANTDTGSGKFITSASEAALADDTATSLISLREAGTDTYTLLAQGEQYHYPRLVNTVDGTGANHHFTLTSNTPTGYKTVTQDYLIKLWDCNSRTTASNVYGQPAMNAFVYAKPTASTKVSDPFELYLIKLSQYNYSSSHLTFENLTHITLNKDTGISQEHIKSFSVGAGGEIFAIQTGEGGSTAGLMKVIRPF